MKIHILFGQRKERYDGEYAPEVLACWDEFSVDENPIGWDEACDEARGTYGPDMAAMRIIEVEVDGDKISKLLNAAPVVKGEVGAST